MSINSKTTTEISVDSVEVLPKKSTTLAADSNKHCVDILPPNEVVAIKKEYSIVGDAFYAGINSDTAPTWLTALINNVVNNSIANGLTDYNALVQDVRNAIDSIDVAKNSYVEEINFSTRVNGIVGTHIETLNATYDTKFATITNLDLVEASVNQSIALSAQDLQAQFTDDINSRITIVNQAMANNYQANADSITSLTTMFTDQETNMSGIANAVTGLQTYVGLDYSSSNPNGLGMLARIGTLEKQSDGLVDFTSNIYDVMDGVTNPNTNINDDRLITDALPYALWTNMYGVGVPTATVRTFKDYEKTPVIVSNAAILEGTIYIRTDDVNVTDVNIDKYYKFTGGSWTAITEAQYLNDKELLRNAHVGDVYIMYDNTNGTRNYIKSYKFIKIAPDATSPYATDTEGYTWALVTDTDSQSIYMTALQARDMADGKISNFYAWGDDDDVVDKSPKDRTITTKQAEYKVDSYGNYLDINNNITTDPAAYVLITPAETYNLSAVNVVFWFTGGKLYKKGTSWADKVLVPTTSGGSEFIAEGDLLTVFDPVTGDTSVYWYNNGSWVSNGPSGIISKSKWFVDLDDAVTGPHGHVAKAMSDLKVTNKAYADNVSNKVESKFSYDSTVILNGVQYEAGFGLDVTGSSQIGVDGAGDPIFSSKFRVNAENFVLTNPNYPGVEAKFNVTSTGLKLSLDQTEATRNIPRGEYNASTTYIQGDIVTLSGSSYLALSNVPTGTPPTNTTYWSLLSAKGSDGVSYTGTTEYYKLTNSSTAPLISSGGWSTSPQTPTATNRYLWNYNKNSKSNGTYTNSSVSLVTQYVENGVGIASISDWYQLGTSSTSYPTGTWSSTFSGAGAISDATPYMWNRTLINYTDGTNSGYSYTLIAAKGTNGANGVSYTGTSEYYKVTNSATAPTNGGSSGTGWSTSPVIPTASNRYLWNYNVSNKSDGSYDIGAVSLITQYVEDGAGIASITEQYQRGSSATTAPTGIWYSTIANAGPLTVTYPYMWNKTTINYTQGKPSTVTITIIAAKGDNGANGVRGTAVLSYSADLGSTTTSGATSSIASYWSSLASSEYKPEREGDTLIVTNTNVAAGWTHIYEYKAGSWTAANTFTVNGNQVVNGTLSADAIGSGSFLTTKLSTAAVPAGYSGTIIDSNGMRVYESGVLRVKIGNLV